MKIATWNLRNFYDAGTFVDKEAEEAISEELFTKRVAYFTKIFREQDIDIICLQEVGGEKGITMISEDLGYDCFIAKPDKRGIRMAVMYKKSLPYKLTCESVSLGDLFMPSIHEKGDTGSLSPIKQRREILVVSVDSYHGKKLRLVTFHLKSFLPLFLEGENYESDRETYVDAKFRCIFYKLMEMRALRSYADKTLDEQSEVVFLGDFNEHYKSSGFDILKTSNDEKRVLHDVLIGYKGNPATHIHDNVPLTFDTVVVSEEMSNLVENVDVLNQDLKCYSDVSLSEAIVESDHAMVVVTFRR